MRSRPAGLTVRRRRHQRREPGRRRRRRWPILALVAAAFAWRQRELAENERRFGSHSART